MKQLTIHGVKVLLKHIKENNIENPNVLELVEQLGLAAPSISQLAPTIMDIIGESKNFELVESFIVDGEKEVLKPLVGQVMQIHRGAEPAWVFELMMTGINRKYSDEISFDDDPIVIG